MKYQILKPLDESWETLGQILRDLQYNTWKALNKTIQLHWEFDNLGAEYKKQTGVYPAKENMQEWTGYKGIEGYIYNVLKDEYSLFNKGNLTQTIQQGSKRWKEDRKSVYVGERSVPSFKRTTPIMLNRNNISIYRDSNGYIAKLGLVSMNKLKEMNRKPGGFPLVIIAKDASSKTILNRIISGEYSIGGSKIIYNKKNRKWFLLLTYSFKQKETGLSPEKVMGIDLGIVNPVCMAFNDSLARYYIEGGEIEAFRKRIESRRIQMLRQGKYCGKGRRGHGKNARIKPIEKLSDRANDFKDTTNHKYSRFIIDMALKHNCGIIQMEDLSGISSNSFFLKNWTYFDLQTKIEYKAKEVGIKVVKTNPQYTSQRCSECGYIDEENRKKQSEFKCLKCGYTENADYNAARNIANPQIEKLIKKQLEK